MFSFIASLVHDLTTSLCPDGCSEGACLELVIAFVFALLGYLVSGSVLESKAWHSGVVARKEQKVVSELDTLTYDVLDDGLSLDDLASMDTEALLEKAVQAEVENELGVTRSRCFESALC